MAKRSAQTELNHDNWDAEDEKEEAGTFKVLDPSQLQNRVIKKARRSLKNSPSGSTGVSPFAQFAGFASTASPSSAFGTPKNNSTTTASSLFGSLKNTGSTVSSSPFGSLKNTNSIAASSLFSFGKKADGLKANGSATDNAEKKTTVDSKMDDNKTNTSATCSSQDKLVRDVEFYRQLQGLNEGVLKWMQLHLAKNACCDFTPVFEDYRKHLQTLNLSYPVQKDKMAGVLLSETDASASKEKAEGKDICNQSTRKNSVEKKSNDETEYGAHFASNTTNTSTFSFGIKSTPTATSSNTPSGPTSSSKEEEAGEAANEKNTSQFSFGFFSKGFQPNSDNKPFSFGLAAAGEKPSESSEAAEEKEYVPPKNDFVAVSEEGAVYSKRCKLFYKKGDSYADKGVGTLYLKPLEGKTQLLMRADTNLGNILLNIMLSASLPMSRTGKNNVLLVCVPNPPADAKNPDSKEPIPMLIRVKTSEDADELLENLNKYKS